MKARMFKEIETVLIDKRDVPPYWDFLDYACYIALQDLYALYHKGDLYRDEANMHRRELKTRYVESKELLDGISVSCIQTFPLVKAYYQEPTIQNANRVAETLNRAWFQNKYLKDLITIREGAYFS